MGYVHQLLGFLHMWPADQPTMMVVALFQERYGTHDLGKISATTVALSVSCFRLWPDVHTVGANTLCGSAANVTTGSITLWNMYHNNAVLQ
jgi:hypothetical protein